MKNFASNMVCLIVIACAALIAQAGTVIQQEGGDPNTATDKRTVTLYIDSGKLRMEQQDGQAKKFVAIFDDSRQVMWVIDGEHNTYMEMTAAQVNGMANQMNAMKQQMQAQLEQMPPQQRKMMEDMMKQRMGAMGQNAPATVTVNEKGSEKVGQFSTTKYEVLKNGDHTSDLWAASPDQVHLGASDIATFKALAKFYEPLTRNAPKGSWSATQMMDQIKGFPVKTVDYQDQKPTFQWVVTKAEQKSIDGSLFTLPSGLTKQEMPGPGAMGGGMGQGRMGRPQ